MKALGIILAGGNNSKMQELYNKRAIAAMQVEVIAVLILHLAI